MYNNNFTTSGKVSMYYCPSNKRRKPTNYCGHCHSAMCGEHERCAVLTATTIELISVAPKHVTKV